MPLQVYSTLTRKKEPFAKKKGETVTMYVCGPTVYKPSHIGHMVGPVIFDTVKRYLAFCGWKVTWIVNITDVDDKLIKRAAELATTVPALAEKMTADYFDCLKKLNVVGIDQFPKATDHIDGMKEMIGTLITKGHAYAAGGDVYFDVSADPDYGKLCNRDPEQLEAGSRIEVSEKKKNPGDFALWKGAKPGEPKDVTWESPWGPGRPGWHIECSVMATKILGNTIDIHGGGLDLQFPHHENELAQAESATGETFARIWMHNGLLRMGSAKMAGSVGNVVNVADALQHMSGDAIRFFLLSTHYRSPIDMGEWPVDPATNKHIKPLPDGMLAAKAAHDTFVRFAERTKRVTGIEFAKLDLPTSHNSGSRPTATMDQASYIRRFSQYMDDDFNTGGAVGVLFELVTALNKTADRGRLEDPANADEGVRAEFREGAVLAKEFADILGLTFTSAPAAVSGDKLAGSLIQMIVDLRTTLRTEAKKIAAKDDPVKGMLYDQATKVRQQLEALGVVVEDRPTGTSWRMA
jgi:cysteinyl-tRNA synthetase